MRHLFLILGFIAIATSPVSSQAGVIFDTESFSVAPPESVSYAQIGDLNGDGIDDLAFGVPTDDDGGTDKGAVHIVFLTSEGQTFTAWKISDLFGFVGLDEGDQFGASIASLGDIDGDGLPDLAVGAPGDDDIGISHGTVWILFLKPNGTVRTSTKIYPPPVFLTSPQFGYSIAGAGDIDSNGILDLLVGAPRDEGSGDSEGAVYSVLLNSDGTPSTIQKISTSIGGFTGDLNVHDFFGATLAKIGDIDGNGVQDFLVGSPGADVSSIVNVGSAWVLRLKTDGTVLGTTKLSAIHLSSAVFGLKLGAAGDVDGDGILDVAIQDANRTYFIYLNSDGSSHDFMQGPPGSGHFLTCISDCFQAVLTPMGTLKDRGYEPNGVGRLLELGGNGPQVLVHSCPTATWNYRTGSGANDFLFINQTVPALGDDWRTNLNCIAHAPGFAVIFAFSGQGFGLIVSAGEILVDLASPMLLSSIAMHFGGVVSFSIQVPFDSSLCGLTASVQGLCLGAPGPSLSNAIDIQLGT